MASQTLFPGLGARRGTSLCWNRSCRSACDTEYLAHLEALPLDEFSLRFTRSKKGLKETRQGGLFGVFRDASPEGFGLALLEQLRGSTLSHPFDIAPYITFSGTLAMAITREGSSMATTENLLKTCENFAYESTEAAHYIGATKDTLATAWGEEQAACGFPPDTLPAPGFEWLAR